VQAPVLNPYEYDFHEDPYPTCKRLRDEAPLYHDEQLNFWALSRHRDAYRVMSFLAMDDPGHLRLRTPVSKSTRFDFVAEFAGKLPMNVISELTGVPEADRARVRLLADGVLHRDGGLAAVRVRSSNVRGFACLPVTVEAA